MAGIYVYQEGNNGPVKVGKANRHPESKGGRRSQLQTGNSQRLYLRGWRPVAKPFEIEAATHRRLAKWRLAGEWFNVDPAFAVAALDDAINQAQHPLERRLRKLLRRLKVGFKLFLVILCALALLWLWFAAQPAALVPIH
jgi:hypothetical protein